MSDLLHDWQFGNVLGRLTVDERSIEVSRILRAHDSALRAENERLRKLLRRFEWQRDEGGYVMCPECDQTKGTPHLNGCQLGAALAAPEEE